MPPLCQTETPFFDALVDYVKADVLSFHMPGHQQGRGAHPRFRDFMARHALAGDITQVLGMDDIHRPETVCLRAQQLAAQAYGADHTYFLVNGSSSGNQIMFMAALRADEVVLLPRNAHRSVMGAVILCGARPVYYDTPYDEEMGVYHAATVAEVTRALDRTPEARALFFSSPTYYGACADTAALVELGHARGLTVLVDEAWGPHLAFHPDLPLSAVQAGADLVVQSTHKLLPALSQASMLHLRGSRVERGRLEATLKMLLTTSPSCLLVASLDVARQQMVERGRELLDECIALAQAARVGINQMAGLRCFEKPSWDPTRLVVAASGWSGYDLEKFLRGHGIQVEMAELRNLVLVITPGHTREHVQRLLRALEQLPRGAAKSAPPSPLPPFPEQCITLRQAFDATHETVALEEAAGRVCAEFVTPYPPGIPLICPGERLNVELIDYLKTELMAGVRIQGAFDQQLKTIRVVVG